MVRGPIVAAAALLASACCAPPATVKVPIERPCPEPAPTTRPYVPFEDLPANAPDAEVQKACIGSLEAVGGYAEELETVLNGYRKPKKE